MRKIASLLLVFLAVIIVLVSCSSRNSVNNDDDGTFNGMKIPSTFTFSTTTEVLVEIEAFLPNGQPAKGVRYDLYEGSPLEDGRRLASYFLDANGRISTTLNLPSRLREVNIYTEFKGLDPLAEVTISNNRIQYQYKPISQATAKLNSSEASLQSVGEYLTLGNWHPNSGRPDYLETPDNISLEFLQRINDLLPERKNIPADPDLAYLLDENVSRKLYLQEDSDVWITFIGSGAGWRNVMGYYYYTADNIPQTPADIENKTIIFPHSHTNLGALIVGDKVKLRGQREDGGFLAGTYIGWFVIADGFVRNEGITSGRWTLYSDKDLNTFIPEAHLREHMIPIFDVEENKLVLAWEDWRRNHNHSDQDFNDILFYTTWNPITSVDTAMYPKLGTVNNDPVFVNNYFPAENTFGTLAFEDLWPSYGDYDMNDLVVDYQIRELTSQFNTISEIEFTLAIRATGAIYKNGMGFELSVPANRVANVSGNRLTTNTITTTGSGVEVGHQNAVIIVFDDANYNLPEFSNVYAGANHADEDTIRVRVQFAVPVSKLELGNAPYNPFIILNQERSREVHLPGMRPTALANRALFGLHDDDTRPDINRFYQSKNNLNWAIHIPQSIPHPRENVDMTDAYLRFRDWAESNGELYPDWYLDKPGYRNRSLLYIIER